MQRIRALQIVFYKTESNNEPVREWLRSLQKTEKKLIGEDIKAVQLEWPIGMPTVRKLDKDLWEIRTHLENKIARVLFTVLETNVVLLHGFVKKSQKTPREDLNLAKQRMRILI